MIGSTVRAAVNGATKGDAQPEGKGDGAACASLRLSVIESARLVSTASVI